MTPTQAKKLIQAELVSRSLPFTKLTARTISFADLARAECIFVTIHGWRPNPQWESLRQLAVANGFRIEA